MALNVVIHIGGNVFLLIDNIHKQEHIVIITLSVFNMAMTSVRVLLGK